jgi:hypothetical protein
MDGDARKKGGVRAFLIGGLLGASAGVAAVSRRRRVEKSRQRPRGLAAFESAPCYRELLERKLE